MLDPKPFIEILRRATHCRYSTLIMNNRMLMQCYDIDTDSEVGLNYALFIPNSDNKKYEDGFYDQTLIFNPTAILGQYSKGHKYIEQRRKETSLKPKDAKEELCFHIIDNTTAELRFMFYLQDELIISTNYVLQYPIDIHTKEVENCLQTYDNLMTRIRPGGACLIFDGLRYDLQNKALECPEIYHFIVRYAGKKIRIPLLRSMFSGIKNVDTLFLSIQESTLTDIFVYSFQYTKKDLTEQYWGYLLNY